MIYINIRYNIKKTQIQYVIATTSSTYYIYTVHKCVFETHTGWLLTVCIFSVLLYSLYSLSWNLNVWNLNVCLSSSSVPSQKSYSYNLYLMFLNYILQNILFKLLLVCYIRFWILDTTLYTLRCSFSLNFPLWEIKYILVTLFLYDKPCHQCKNKK